MDYQMTTGGSRSEPECLAESMHDFRRTAVRNLERDGVSRSAAMAMVGHKTESIYRRYAIVDAGALRDAATKIDRAANRGVSGTQAALKAAEAHGASR